VGGVRAAAWPLIRTDLGLSYAEIGLLLGIPGVVGSALEPIVGVLSDAGRRRTLVVAGGVLFALSAALAGLSLGFWTLLVALLIGYPAASAFVSLSQATLIDLTPGGRERSMAWWTLAGSVGYVGGPLLLTVGLALGLGWRGVTLALALSALLLTLAARRVPVVPATNGCGLLRATAEVLAALRRRAVARSLVLLKSADLLLDVFHGFLALYLVDVVGMSPAEAAFGVTVWTGAGLVGDALLIPVLRCLAGGTYLRATGLAALLAYPAFLLVDEPGTRLVLLALLGILNSGWYAIPKAGLYEALPGRSGAAVAVSGVAGLVSACVPAALGLLAGAIGLGATMWLLLAAPVAVVLLAPRRR
jgi:FSR family fosmidomycin resistance protein-like MFS transporter